ncbi:MAG: NAD(P)H-hydrate dehydratase [Clostridia bacterium]|nr:NAD(P)H-hydrate dehydratase [Clostridia bacterium]
MEIIMKVCTSAQMRAIDKSAEELGGIPSVVLMENAAIACMEEIIKNKNIKNVAVFCGKGNNGGDGFALARHLFNRGINVCVYLVCGSEFSGDALINFEIISKMGINIKELYDSDLSEYELKFYDIVIDAIFGTGIRGSVEGLAREIIESINKNCENIFSVDIPSGINADTGEICGVCVKADTTVTFAAYKLGLLLYPGADYTGNLTVKDISIPKYITEGQNININVIDREMIEGIMPERKADSHKGDYGKVLIVGGSTGMSGAVAMAAQACVRCGAGLVTAAVPECINSALEVKLTEPMTIPLPAEKGQVNSECIEKLCDIINNYDVCLFGPGIGRNDYIGEILEKLLEKSQIPVIIDADGLFALAQRDYIIDKCNCNIVLTPHEMEMSRISKCGLDYVKNNRIELSQSFATGHGVTLILKGAHTIVTSMSGEQYININGNNGMAVGGSGDVLAGMTAAFVGRGMNESDAACLAVYLHGLSGDICAEELGCDAMLPTDIIKNIPNALKLPID